MMIPTVASDAGAGAQFCQYTLAAYDGTANTQPYTSATDPAKVAAVQNNSPYTSAQFSATGYQQRLTCASIRIKYSGTELTKAGSILGFVHPQHINLMSAAGTWNAVLANDGVSSRPTSRQWQKVTWTPVHRHEIDYSTNTFVANYASTTAGAQLIIFGSGTAGQTYDFEMVAHYEVVGAAVIGTTPSFASPQTEPALNHVQAITNTNAPTGLNHIVEHQVAPIHNRMSTNPLDGGNWDRVVGAPTGYLGVVGNAASRAARRGARAIVNGMIDMGTGRIGQQIFRSALSGARVPLPMLM